MRTTDPEAGAGSEPEVPFDQRLASDVLATEVIAVLEVAHEKARTLRSDAFEETLTTAGARRSLDMIKGYPSLRALCARHLPGQDGVEPTVGYVLAAQLVAPDANISGEACDRVRGQLDAARTEARSVRRKQKQASRPTAEQRFAGRDRAERDKLRAERDRARGKETLAWETLAKREEELAEIRAEMVEVLDQQAASDKALVSLRRELEVPANAAQRLWDALAAEERQKAAAEKVGAPNPPEFGTLPVPTTPELLTEATQIALAGIEIADDARAMVAETVADWFPKLLASFANPPRLEAIRELDLTVDVIGGGDHIGGSCVLVSAGGTRILIDCGSRPRGTDVATMRPEGIDRALAEKVDAVIVTHAHNDHGGWVPAVVRAQPHIVVLGTQATCDLLTTMWMDSAKVLASQADDGRWTDVLPPYSRNDVVEAREMLRDIPFGRPTRIGAVTVELFRAGHIVGAAGVVVTAGEYRVVVTGDVSGPGQATVGGFVPSASALGADLVLLESTYAGQQDPDPRSKVVADFVRTVELTMDKGGIALVPAFALGRAQEIALMCAVHLPDVEVLVDGLARAVTETYQDYEGPNRKRLEIFGGNVRPVAHGKTIDERIRFKSGVVISTAGMMTSGPVVSWARRVLPDTNSSLLLVGYQDTNSPGASLLNLTRAGGTGAKFRLPPVGDRPAEEVEVHAQVEEFKLGAHASATELVGIADRLHPARLMLVHGEATKQLDLGRRMKTRGHRLLSSREVWRPGRSG